MWHTVCIFFDGRAWVLLLPRGKTLLGKDALYINFDEERRRNDELETSSLESNQSLHHGFNANGRGQFTESEKRKGN
jgi:hypothetical protein